MDKGDLIVLGAVSVTGALIGLGLSFTALSPLVIGGIIAAIPVILLSACFIHDGVKKGEFSGMFKKVCQTAFLVQLNFQSIRKENVELRHS